MPRFKRNPNFFKEGRAHFDEVELLSILDATARQNAIMNGDVDIIDNVPAKTVALLARVPILTILETTGTQHYTFPMRLDTKPFDNYDVRMALKLSIKRQELVDKILLGHGVIGNDIPVSAAMPYLNTDLKQREFDADKARHLQEIRAFRPHQAVRIRCGVCRCSRRRSAHRRFGQNRWHRHRNRARAEGWLLVQRME